MKEDKFILEKIYIDRDISTGNYIFNVPVANCKIKLFKANKEFYLNITSKDTKNGENITIRDVLTTIKVMESKVDHAQDDVDLDLVEAALAFCNKNDSGHSKELFAKLEEMPKDFFPLIMKHGDKLAHNTIRGPIFGGHVHNPTIKPFVNPWPGTLSTDSGEYITYTSGSAGTAAPRGEDDA